MYSTFFNAISSNLRVLSYNGQIRYKIILSFHIRNSKELALCILKMYKSTLKNLYIYGHILT